MHEVMRRVCRSDPVPFDAVNGLVDSGWQAWLPFELLDALEALSGPAKARRSLRDSLAREPDPERQARWERFRLVAPSRLDVPLSAHGLTPQQCFALLADLGLVAGDPLRIVPAEPIELVLTLDHDELRELEALRAARAVDGVGETARDDLPALDTTFGAGVGRNDPCPCGSGRKFKRCHGA
jgi:hypothetical protein